MIITLIGMTGVLGLSPFKPSMAETTVIEGVMMPH